MAITETTKITCDYLDPKTGKQCPKIILVPDPPAKPTQGWEKVLRLVDVEGVKNARSFCCMRHLLGFCVAYLKATPKEDKPLMPVIEEPTPEQIKALTSAGIIEPGSGPLAPPEDLNLREE